MRILIFKRLLILTLVGLSLAWSIDISPSNPGRYNNYYIRQIVITQDVAYQQIQKSQLRYLQEKDRFYDAYLVNDLLDLLKLGYVQDVKVEVKRSAAREVTVIFNIEMNPIIDQVELSNVSVFPKEKLEQKLSNKAGNPMNYLTISEDIKIIESAYYSEGYVLAKVTNVFFVKSLKTLIFNVEEGIIDRIIFEGLTSIKDRILLREMENVPGTVLNMNTLRKDRKKIMNLGFFSKVTVPRIIPSQKTPNRVDVILEVAERKINHLQVGLEQLPNDRWSVALGMNFPNFRNTGEGIYFKGQSIIESGLQEYNYYLRYTEPWFLNQRLPLKAVFWHQVNQEKQDNNPAVAVQRNGWQTSIDWPFFQGIHFTSAFRREWVTDTTSTYPRYDKDSVRLTFIHNTLTELNHPKSGTRTLIEVEKGNNLLQIIHFGGIDFSKYLFSHSRFINVFRDDVLALNVEGGVLNYGGQAQIFEQDSFVLGGAYSLRGYPDSYATSSGGMIGSRKLLFNVEYRMMFAEWIQGALFMDWGTASSGDLDLANFKLGAGVGLRFFTPLAPLRFDFAIGDNNQFQLHFGLGQLF